MSCETKDKEKNRFERNFVEVQEELRQLFLKKPEFRDELEITLLNAVETGLQTLRPSLTKGLDEEFNGKAWPKSVEDWSGVLLKPIDGKYFKKDDTGI